MKKLLLLLPTLAILVLPGCAAVTPVTAAAPGFEIKDDDGGTDRHNAILL